MPQVIYEARQREHLNSGQHLTPEQRAKNDRHLEKLNAWQGRIEADELMTLNLEHSSLAIYRTTELIADAFGLLPNMGQ